MRHSIQVYDRKIRIGPRQLSEASGVHEEIILELERVGLLSSETDGTNGRPVFEVTSIRRCREIDRLHRCHHLSFHFIRRFLELQDRLDRAERALSANGVRWEA